MARCKVAPSCSTVSLRSNPANGNDKENARQQFIEKYREQIVGMLTGFDRLVFRGSLRRLNASFFDRTRQVVVAKGMEEYCWQNQILFKHYGDHVRRTSEKLKSRSLQPYRDAGVTIEFVRTPP